MRKQGARDDAQAAEWKPLVLQTPVLVLIMLGAGGLVFFSAFTSVEPQNAELDTTTRPPRVEVFDSRTIRKAAPEDPYTLQEAPVALRQRDMQVRKVAGVYVDCFHKECHAELLECKSSKTCRVAMRHQTRGCWTSAQSVCDELLFVGLLQECPESFRTLFSCFSQSCYNMSAIALEGKHAAYVYRNKKSAEARQDILDAAHSLYVAANTTAENATVEGSWGVVVEGHDSHEIQGHRVGFNVSMFRNQTGSLLDRLTQIAKEADKLHDWGVWREFRKAGKVFSIGSDAEADELARPELDGAGYETGGASLKIRCVETHEYSSYKQEESPKEFEDWSEWSKNMSEWRQRIYVQSEKHGMLPYAWHCDDSSMVTMALVLSASEDFQGGQFRQRGPSPCGEEVVFDLKPGDILVWESWRNHILMPVISGRRKVLIVEFWEYPDAVTAEDVGTHESKGKLTRDDSRPEHVAWMTNRRNLLKQLLR